MKLGRTLLATLLLTAPLAWAQEAPATPERIAQLSYVEGRIRFQGDGETETSALPARALAAGDRIGTEPGGRAEISLGSAMLRLDEQSTLEVTELAVDTVRVRLQSGVALVTVRGLGDNERLEVATPNASISLDAPGDYRVEAPADDVSFLTVHGGAATVAAAAGPVPVADGQRARLSGPESLVSLESARTNDDFDQWALGREAKLAEAQPSDAGEQDDELARYGEWQDEPQYGRVWMPAYSYGYDPFRSGYWQPVGYGFAWVDTSPWAPYTFNDGYWAYVHHLHRWCWVPARHVTHPRVPPSRDPVPPRPRLPKPIPIDPPHPDRAPLPVVKPSTPDVAPPPPKPSKPSQPATTPTPTPKPRPQPQADPVKPKPAPPPTPTVPQPKRESGARSLP